MHAGSWETLNILQCCLIQSMQRRKGLLFFQASCTFTFVKPHATPGGQIFQLVKIFLNGGSSFWCVPFTWYHPQTL